MPASHHAKRSNWTETNYTELNKPATDPRTASDSSATIANWKLLKMLHLVLLCKLFSVTWHNSKLSLVIHVTDKQRVVSQLEDRAHQAALLNCDLKFESQKKQFAIFAN